MPIYEFYCPDCHTIFSFLARSVTTRKRPDCPRCRRPRLERKPSAFAVSTGRSEPSGEREPPPGIDEAGMERMLAELARESEGLDENDPRQMTGVLRKMLDRAGMPVGPGMEEAMRRLEAGEDPDRIEEELGSALEDEEASLLGPVRRKLRAPAVDTTLYEL